MLLRGTGSMRSTARQRAVSANCKSTIPQRASRTLVKAVPVAEVLILLRANDEASEENQTAMVEQLWSMQYRLPGVLTGAGGSLSYPDPPVKVSMSSGLQGYSHAVFFRFGNTKQAQTFLSTPYIQGMLTTTGAPVSVSAAASDDLPATETIPICLKTNIISYTGAMESDLEALFRRGPEYAEGEDLILLLKKTATNSAGPADDGDAQEFLSQLAIIAQSSLAGAVQVTYGAVQDLLGGGSDLQDGYLLMARFPSQQELEAFLGTEPMQALWMQAQAFQGRPVAASDDDVFLPVYAAEQLVLSAAPSSSESSKMR